MSAEDKEMLIAQRHADYARNAGDTPTLIENLIITGGLDEAMSLGSSEAFKVKAAIERPDDERCDCEVELGKKYIRIRPYIWNHKLNKVTGLYRCVVCSHLNAFDGEVDEASAKINRLRLESKPVPDSQLSKELI